MSRPIKFRAWDDIKKCMLFEMSEYHVENVLNPFDGFMHYEFMQFAGKQDSKGTDIWEDDIVKIVRPWPEVGPNPVDKEFYVLIKWSEDACGFPDASAVADGEVVGNWWEHPDLRKLVDESI